MLEKLITGALGGAWGYVAAGGAALVLVGGIFAAGWNARDSSCDAAAVRLELAAVKRDLAAARAAEAAAVALAAAADKDADALQGKVDDYAKSLAARPRGGSCTLTPDDARRLRDFR